MAEKAKTGSEATGSSAAADSTGDTRLLETRAGASSPEEEVTWRRKRLLMQRRIAHSFDAKTTQFRCKDHGPAIRFPFRLKGMQPLHCDYPGFDLSCNKDKQTLLHITPSSADKFLVKRIDYTAQGIEIYIYNNHYDYFDDFKNICISRQIFELSSSPFEFSDAQVKTDYTIFSCPPLDERDRLPYQLAKLSPCLGNHSNMMYALDDLYADLESTPELVLCTKVEDYRSVPSFRLQPLLKLKWSRPSCKRCEEMGKTCGLLNQVADDQTTEETQWWRERRKDPKKKI